MTEVVESARLVHLDRGERLCRCDRSHDQPERDGDRSAERCGFLLEVLHCQSQRE